MAEQAVQKWTFRRAFFHSLDVVFGLLIRVWPIRIVFQRILIALGWWWSYHTFRRRNKVRIIGRENFLKLMRKIGILFVVKHLTLIDSFLVALALIGFWEAVLHPERIPWNAPDAKNYLSKPFFRHIFGLLKTVPVVRGSTSLATNRAMLRNFQQCLKTSSLVIFPEGGRGPSDEIGSFKDGMASIIYHTKNVVVIPIFLDGIEQIMPKEGGFSIKGIRSGFEGSVVIGQEIIFSDLQAEPHFNDELRARINNRVRDAMLSLKKQLE